MTDARRVTVYLEPNAHRALKLKAASTERSVSEIVNDAVRAALAEEAEDLEGFVKRASEPEWAFEDFVNSIKRSPKP